MKKIYWFSASMGRNIEEASHIFPLPIENYSVGKRGGSEHDVCAWLEDFLAA